jgi:hypothetical protein
MDSLNRKQRQYKLDRPLTIILTAQGDYKSINVRESSTGTSCQENSHVGLGLFQNGEELSRLLRVVGSEVGVRDTSVTGSTSSTDSVNVVFTVVGEVVVDDVFDVLDICG